MRDAVSVISVLAGLAIVAALAMRYIDDLAWAAAAATLLSIPVARCAARQEDG